MNPWVNLVGPARDQDSVELVPDWSKADMEKMKENLANIDWESKFEGKSGVVSWDISRDVRKEETERCVPKKKRRNNRNQSG